MRIVTASIFIVTFVAACLYADKPSRTFDLYRNWSSGNGLPHTAVNTIIRSRTGYLWLGTQAGLVRFDGVSMKVFDKWNTPGFDNDRILSLCEDSSGTIWIGTDGSGIYTLDQGIIEKASCSALLKDLHISALAADTRGRVWIGTEYGLYRVNHDDVKTFTKENGLLDNIITDLAADTCGRVWAATLQGGIALLDDTVIRVYMENDGLPNSSVLSLAVSPGNMLWAGTMGGVSYLNIQEDVFKKAPLRFPFPVTALGAAPDSGAVIGTRRNGLMYSSVYSSFMCEHPDLKEASILSILSLSGNTLFLGTKDQGLVKLRPADAAGLDIPGFTETYAACFAREERGKIWIGTRNGLVSVIKNKSGSYSIQEKLFSGTMITALHISSSNSLWAGTKRSICKMRISGKRAEIQATWDIPGGASVIRSGSHTSVWAGGQQGVYSIDARTLTGPAPVSGLPPLEIHDMITDSSGPLYIAAENGVWHRTERGFRRLDPSATGMRYHSICLDTTGILLAGTDGGGLKIWDSNNWHTISEQDGLPDNIIYSVTCDSSSIFWIGTTNGICKIPGDSLRSYIASETDHLSLTWFDERDGMAGSSCMNSGNPSMVYTGSGEMWYTTSGGITMFLFSRESDRSQQRPVVAVESVSVNGKKLPLSNRLYLPAAAAPVTVGFTGFDAAAPEKLRFFTALHGTRERFFEIYPGMERKVVLKDLPAGVYDFSIYAVSNRGKRSFTKNLQIEIQNTLYRSPAFIIIVLFLLASTSAVIMWFVRGKKKKDTNEKYKTTHIDPEHVRTATQRLEKAMNEEKIYLSPDVTLAGLAKKAGIHSNYLSRIINEQFEMSFNDYINSHRINEARHRLSDPACQNQTILEILYDTGFYSKSVFNTAFKKFTGMTPSAYRKKYCKK